MIISMRFVLTFLSAFILSASLFAEEDIWKNNKMTQAQPFAAKVLAIESSWGGYRLLLQSMEDASQFCIAQVWPGAGPSMRLSYKVIEKKDFSKPSVQWVFIQPAIEVNRFSWSMGAWKIGRVFGDDDSLQIVLRQRKSGRE